MPSHRSSNIAYGLLPLLLMLIPPGIQAQQLKGVRIEPARSAPGQPNLIVVDIAARDGAGFTCGLLLSFGDGNTQEMRITEKDVPLRVSRAWASAGNFSVSASGKLVMRGLRSSLPCEGGMQSAAVLIEARSEAQAAERNVEQNSAGSSQADKRNPEQNSAANVQAAAAAPPATTVPPPVTGTSPANAARAAATPSSPVTSQASQTIAPAPAATRRDEAPVPTTSQRAPAAPAADRPPPVFRPTPVGSGPLPRPLQKAKVLPPFKGFETDNVEAQTRLKDSRQPWGATTPAGGAPATALDAAKLSEHQGSVRHAMSRMLTLHGDLTPQEKKDFGAMWAPYFDHPTTESLAHFKQLNPLLDQYTAAAAQAEAIAPSYREGLELLAMAAASGSDQATAAALDAVAAQATVMKESQQLMAETLAQIRKLGNPPSPVKAKAQARRQHASAVRRISQPQYSDADGQWVLIARRTVPIKASRAPFGAITQIANIKTARTAFDSNALVDGPGADAVCTWNATEESMGIDPAEEAKRQRALEVQAEEDRRASRIRLCRPGADPDSEECSGPATPMRLKSEMTSYSVIARSLAPPFGRPDWADARVFLNYGIAASAVASIAKALGEKPPEPDPADVLRNVYGDPLDLRASVQVSQKPVRAEADPAVLGLTYRFLPKEASAEELSGWVSSGNFPGGDYTQAAGSWRFGYLRTSPGAGTTDRERKATLSIDQTKHLFPPPPVYSRGRAGEIGIGDKQVTAKPGELRPLGRSYMLDPRWDLVVWVDLGLTGRSTSNNAVQSCARMTYRYRWVAGGEPMPANAALRRDTANLAAAQAAQQAADLPEIPDDPEARKEAISLHESLAQQRDADALKWEAEAKAEKDPIQKAKLLEEAAWRHDMAQAERDIAESLRTGTIVHTRTEWQDRQQQKLISKIKEELTQFDQDSHNISMLPKLGNLVQGADGVRLREQLQKQIQEALKSPDRGKRLQQMVEQMRKVVTTQREADAAVEEARLAEKEFHLATAEGLKAGADAAIYASSFLVPGAGAVSMAYGLGSGYVEGGVWQALEISAGAYSNYIEVAIAGVRGAFERDPVTGKMGGITGAAYGALSTVVTNHLMGWATTRSTNFLQANINRANAPRLSAAVGDRPRPASFKDNHERMQEALVQAKTPEQRQQVAKDFAVIRARENLHNDIQSITAKHETAARKLPTKSDGTVDTSNKEYQRIKAQWQGEVDAARQKYAPENKQRLAEHDKILADSKINPKEDLVQSGSLPGSVNSDMDLTPKTYEIGKRYVDAVRAPPGRRLVLDYPDRWVVPDGDITIWKPGHGGDKPGSSSYEAAVIHDSLPGSDKFQTKGGVEYTTQSGNTNDPRGAVIANAKKFSEASSGGKVDLHVIGKSVDKSMKIAGTEGDPTLVRQAEAVRHHATAEEANITTFGASDRVKAQERAKFVEKSREAMGDAYQKAGEKSAEYDAYLKKQIADAEARNDKATANDAREALMAHRLSNEVALNTMAEHDPRTVGALIGRDPTAAPSKVSRYWLRDAFDQEREDSERNRDITAKPPNLAGLAARSKTASGTLAEKLKALPPGSPEAQHLNKVKVALDRAAVDPVRGVTEVRLLTGHELPQVLRQVGR